MSRVSPSEKHPAAVGGLWCTDTVGVQETSPDPAEHLIVHGTVSAVFSAEGGFPHPDAKMERRLGQD